MKKVSLMFLLIVSTTGLTSMSAAYAGPIKSVQVDYNQNEIYISGKNLIANNKVPKVFLGTTELFLCQTCYSKTAITVSLPNGVSEGDYRLRIRRKQSDNIGFDFTLGAQGPAGVEGPAGVQGPAGASGADGVDGVMGPQGEAGIQGMQGLAGPGGVQGLQGETGEQGASGMQGEAGLQGESGFASIEIISNNWSKQVGGNSSNYVDGTVLCPVGKTVIGGGASTGGNSYSLSTTIPVDGGVSGQDGWTASTSLFINKASINTFIEITVYAICAAAN